MACHRREPARRRRRQHHPGRLGDLRELKAATAEPLRSERRPEWVAASLSSTTTTPADEVKYDLEDFEPGERTVQLDVDGLAGGGNWVLRTRYGRLDVMQWLKVVDDHSALRADALQPTIPGLDPSDTPLFAGLDDLVAMKRAAGRDRDLIDIAELERAQGKGF
jgi:hypothetical protein